jgi:hypothetical protein
MFVLSTHTPEYIALSLLLLASQLSDLVWLGICKWMCFPKSITVCCIVSSMTSTKPPWWLASCCFSHWIHKLSAGATADAQEDWILWNVLSDREGKPDPMKSIITSLVSVSVGMAELGCLTNGVPLPETCKHSCSNRNKSKYWYILHCMLQGLDPLSSIEGFRLKASARDLSALLSDSSESK